MADDETPEGILLSGEENAAVRIKLERESAAGAQSRCRTA